MDTQFFHENNASNEAVSILQGFWNWLGMTPEEYACKGPDLLNSKAEFNFPDFDRFYCCCVDIFDNDRISLEDINNILIMMALDNETEDILDLCCDKLPDQYVDVFITMGIQSIQFHTRWQIAEFIRRRKPLLWKSYLSKLIDDCHPYVRKRAKNSFDYLQF